MGRPREPRPTAVVAIHMRRLSVLLLGPLALAACGGATPRPQVPGQGDTVTMEEMRIVATHTDEGVDFESYDAGQLFERGTRLVNEGRCREAIERYYDRLVEEFPSSRFVAVALYNSALCLQQGGELEASLPYFRRLLEEAPDGRDGRHGALQFAQALVTLERWDEALEVVDHLLLREDLEAEERLEGLTRRAQTLLGLERVEDAERQARNALSYYRMQQRSGRIPDPYFAAAVNFVLAETIRARSEGIPIPAGTAQEQHDVLDRRAQLLLDAQREYFNTIRHTEPEWAAASGYRIGGMFEQLWQALMTAPIPPPSRELAESAMPIYQEEYRAELARHIRPLIRHAIRYWEMTLLLVEQTGLQSDWTERTRTDLERMRQVLLQHGESDEGEEQTEEETPDEAPEAAPSEPSASLPMPRLPSSLTDPSDASEEGLLAGYGSRLTAPHLPST